METQSQPQATETPAETAAPPSTEMFGANNTNEAPKVSFDDYLNTIPEDRRNVLVKNGVKDTDTLLSSYEGLLSLKGKKGFKPDDNAPQEEKDAYLKSIYSDIGVPENGEYSFNTPEGVNPELIQEEFVNNLADVAHKNGISQNAFQSVIDTVYPAYQQEVQQYQQEIQALRAKLGEGTMNPTADAQPTQSVDNDAVAKRLQSEYTDAHRKGDFETYNQKIAEFNKLRGY